MHYKYQKDLRIFTFILIFCLIMFSTLEYYLRILRFLINKVLHTHTTQQTETFKNNGSALGHSNTNKYVNIYINK